MKCYSGFVILKAVIIYFFFRQEVSNTTRVETIGVVNLISNTLQLISFKLINDWKVSKMDAVLTFCNSMQFLVTFETSSVYHVVSYI